MDDLMEEGRAFSKAFLQGYDCLIAVHRDTDNDHIHISINSVRAKARAEQAWMMRDSRGTSSPVRSRQAASIRTVRNYERP